MHKYYFASLWPDMKTYDQKLVDLRSHYAALEQKFGLHFIGTSRYYTPVNFREALATPRHRWYAYKEGFSPIFVENFIRENLVKADGVVFDPFGGIGTTTLTAASMGLTAYSTDVNPLGNFASKVKSRVYSKDDIDRILSQCTSIYEAPNVKSEIDCRTVLNYFDPQTLDSLLRVKWFIDNMSDNTVHGIFKLALLSIVEDISTHRKDGNGVKRKRVSVTPSSYKDLCDVLVKRVKLFIEDIEILPIKLEPAVLEASCINEYELPSKADVVITSPPYANCFDYSKVYLRELWIGDFFQSTIDQKNFRENSISSHVHYKWKRNDREFLPSIIKESIVPLLNNMRLWNKGIPEMLGGYFSDMGRCLFNLSQNLNNDATVGFVVGNSVYSGVPIATDLILADIAETIGYKVQRIDVYRNLSSSPQQMKLMDEKDKVYLRESLVVLKWKI